MLKHIKRDNLKLLFTDTDSLCYHIQEQDIFKIIGENKEYFDLSNYDKNMNCTMLRIRKLLINLKMRV